MPNYMSESDILRSRQNRARAMHILNEYDQKEFERKKKLQEAIEKYQAGKLKKLEDD